MIHFPTSSLVAVQHVHTADAVQTSDIALYLRLVDFVVVYYTGSVENCCNCSRQTEHLCKGSTQHAPQNLQKITHAHVSADQNQY